LEIENKDRELEGLRNEVKQTIANNKKEKELISKSYEEQIEKLEI
jgi:hypothetical protein